MKEVTTVAGPAGKRGYRDGKGAEALFHGPRLPVSLPQLCSALAADSTGNLFIADCRNFRIRKLAVDGCVTTIAGTGEYGYRDGRAEEAQLGYCDGIVVGSDGSIYFSDLDNHVIRKLCKGLVSTLAGKPGEPGKEDGKGEEAQFNSPRGICMDSEGSLLVAGGGDCSIRRVSLDGIVTTLAGTGEKGDRDGDLSQAQFADPHGICRNGEEIFVADYSTGSVKKISEGKVVTLRGVEDTVAVTFFNGQLYTLSDHQVFRGEEFELFAGTGEDGHRDGALLEACFYYPYSLVGSKGSLFVADSRNHCIRKIRAFVEWSPFTHSRADKPTRDAVRTLLLMRRRGALWNQVPREIVFLISVEVHRLRWNNE